MGRLTLGRCVVTNAYVQKSVKVKYRSHGQATTKKKDLTPDLAKEGEKEGRGRRSSAEHCGMMKERRRNNETKWSKRPNKNEPNKYV